LCVRSGLRSTSYLAVGLIVERYPLATPRKQHALVSPCKSKLSDPHRYLHSKGDQGVEGKKGQGVVLPGLGEGHGGVWGTSRSLVDGSWGCERLTRRDHAAKSP